MTPATLLTILRVLLTPVFVLLILYGRLQTALGVFMLAGFTDLMDGLIARRFNQKSELGTLLDPIADKLLLVSSFLVLTFTGVELTVRVPVWLTVTVISRDIVLVTAVVIVNLSLGKHLFPPSIWGKWTTTFQLLTVFLALVGNALDWQVAILSPVLFVTLALTVFSGLHYLARGMRLIEYKDS